MINSDLKSFRSNELELNYQERLIGQLYLVNIQTNLKNRNPDGRSHYQIDIEEKSPRKY